MFKPNITRKKLSAHLESVILELVYAPVVTNTSSLCSATRIVIGTLCPDNFAEEQ